MDIPEVNNIDDLEKLLLQYRQKLMIIIDDIVQKRVPSDVSRQLVEEVIMQLSAVYDQIEFQADNDETKQNMLKHIDAFKKLAASKLN